MLLLLLTLLIASQRLPASVTVHAGANVGIPEAVFFPFDLDTIPFRRNLELTLVRANKHPEPVLRRGPKGSFDELRAEYYGSVLKIGGKFRMWYCGYGFEDPANRTYSGVTAHIGYAESSDGIHWVKPDLGLVTYHGNKRNNIVLIEPEDYTTTHADRNIHVLYEPDDPNPQRRYKMVVYAPHDGGRATMVPLVSADGLRWRYVHRMETTGGTEPRFKIGSTGMPNEHLEGGGLVRVGGIYYLNGQSLNRHDGGLIGRFPATYWSSDFVTWQHEKAVSMLRWGHDGRPPISEGREIHEGVALWNRGNALVGIYGMWQGARNWADRRVHLGLVTTVDAIHYREPVSDFVFVEAGQRGAWDANGLLQGQGFENVGDETYIWYGSWDLTASGGTQVYKDKDMLESHGDVGLLKLRRDGFGFVAVRDPKTAKPRETFHTAVGSLVTVPFRIERTPARVFANVETAAGGKLRFEVLDQRGSPVRGFTLNDSLPLEKPGVRVNVRWKAGNSLAPGTYRLRAQIERAGDSSPRLYAFYVTTEAR
ncbi:MAG: hypothetical protein ACKV22_35490 [Bryobacteraceae bacterium]